MRETETENEMYRRLNSSINFVIFFLDCYTVFFLFSLHMLFIEILAPRSVSITYELVSELEIEMSDPAVSLATEPVCFAPRRW